MDKPAITAEIARSAVQLSIDNVPDAVRKVVSQCVLDYIGVTIAGAGDDAVVPLRDELTEEGGPTQAQVFGTRLRLPILGAAMLNGMASHVLDYDDVNFALMGHPSVPMLPAVLALGESREASGYSVMQAFLAGYEAECAIGLLVAPGHYAAGFHAT